MKLQLSFLLSLFVVSSLFAGPLRDEYYETRSKIEESGGLNDKDGRKKQLEETLTRSLRLVMLRKYQYPEYDKITAGDFEYEKSEINDYTYFIKFKEYIGYFSFSSDPAEYYSMPRDYRLYEKPSASISQHPQGY